MSSGPVFVDTWGWCALGHRADRQHRAALEFYSFTDLTSMVIMQERHIVQVFTADAHFTQVGLGFSLVP
jgi:predicted nucleic acid-binding protein